MFLTGDGESRRGRNRRALPHATPMRRAEHTNGRQGACVMRTGLLREPTWIHWRGFADSVQTCGRAGVHEVVGWDDGSDGGARVERSRLMCCHHHHHSFIHSFVKHLHKNVIADNTWTWPTRLAEHLQWPYSAEKRLKTTKNTYMRTGQSYADTDKIL